MNEEFYDYVDRLKFREALIRFYINSTEKAYRDFGLIYGQTISADPLNHTLKVKVKNKEKWIWTKMKFSL